MAEYNHLKREGHAALVRSLHGSVAGDEEPLPMATPHFDGGVRTDHMPRGEPRPGPYRQPSNEVGWGPEYEVEGGAELLFPWLVDK